MLTEAQFDIVCSRLLVSEQKSDAIEKGGYA